MTNQEILRDNEAVALFMGAKSTIHFDSHKGLIIPVHGVKLGGARDCHYHDDWNWLLPVVLKIEKMGYRVDIIFNSCGIVGKDDQYYTEEKTKLDAVYKAVVEFINRENKNENG